MIRTKNRIFWMFQLFLLLAVMAKGLLPAGFMPGERGRQLFPLVLCSSEGGTRTVMVSARQLPVLPLSHDDLSQKEHGKKNGHDAPCAFSAVFGQGVLPGPAAALPLPARLAEKIAARAGVFAAIFNPRLYFSRGPPG